MLRIDSVQQQILVVVSTPSNKVANQSMNADFRSISEDSMDLSSIVESSMQIATNPRIVSDFCLLRLSITSIITESSTMMAPSRQSTCSAPSRGVSASSLTLTWRRSPALTRLAFSDVFNTCANSGDSKMFLQLFDEMPQCGIVPDALSFNIIMKLCCRIDRKDLLVVVLERILQLNISLCMTTLHSLVAAYVVFGDLETAEKMVQAMKQKGRDPCRILRESNSQYLVESDDSVFHKLLPNLMNHKLLKETAEK
ncbi:Tetratricopeptide-like helical domain superfamily [Sesbania bispinosa]|nr:Tetratricopeptide-like helical domain superfamily [Sesbania bispinosa]